MNHFNLITSLILFGLTVLCFWLPFKVGNKKTGIITGIILSLIIAWTILAKLEFLVIFIWPFILAFQIIFLTYWTFRIFKRPKTGKYISSFLTLGFILLCMSPWISDWTFSKKDARKLLAKHNIELKDDFKILKNESGGFMDYAHTLKIQISDSDKSRTFAWIGEFHNNLTLNTGVEDSLASLIPNIAKNEPAKKFISEFKLRNQVEIFEMLDKFYRAHWFARNNNLTGKQSDKVDLDIIMERRKALEYTVYKEFDWNEISLDT